MKVFALGLILAIPAFAQKPAAPATPAQSAPSPAPAAPLPPQNPCQKLIPIESLDNLDKSALELQIVYANQCILNMQAQRLQSDFQKAGSDLAAKVKQLEAESNSVEVKKEGTK